ncbi:MAG: mitochondrial fission ELM1 family protein [Candidatus Omnitrophica bacterium]|nr:mitochondrial fission ELM1 family protein [Candidatus Omnitrophota bacterium]
MEKKKMPSFNESLIFYSVNWLGALMRLLPLQAALWIGRLVGTLAYYFDIRHKTIAYANIKAVFADSKPPAEIRRITKELFQNYAQNFIDLFRLPLITPQNFQDLITVEGIENLSHGLGQGKGAIMLAMHFGSWELANLSCAMLKLPYKVIVKPQTRYTRLEELLNSYRSCGGYVVLNRGMGTRDFVRSLQNNEVIGMVVDQGGRDGVLVPFFGRSASMSVGAIRMGLKWGVPICFSVIHRQPGGRHKMIVHKPLDLVNTGRMEEDLAANLSQITGIMEDYIRRYPSEYMWFYKIWKYSDQASITILSDEKTGHVRQSQAVARLLQKNLAERETRSSVQEVPVRFKGEFHRNLFAVLNLWLPPFFHQGHLEYLKWFLTDESYARATRVKSDFIVSCGSSVAAVNYFLAKDHGAKSIVVLNPGVLGYRKFNLVILPRHEMPRRVPAGTHLAATVGAPNLITPEYKQEQSQGLLKRYSHLKNNLKIKIGLFIGGDSKDIFLSEHLLKVLVHQLTEVAQEINADILATTSRRTPAAVEELLQKRLRRHPRCPLLVIANKDDVPEAAGGIMGLSDILVVSGDSISMVSEAASSGKKTVVFLPELRRKDQRNSNKHLAFIEQLGAEGYLFASSIKDIGRAVYDIAKGKIQTKPLNDNTAILEALRKII